MQNAPTPPDDFEPWEIVLIANVVKSFLSTRSHSPHLSQDDLEQEGQLHWWRQRVRYSSERGAKKQPFLRRVVGARLLDIERELHAEKRGGVEGALSLDVPAGEDSDTSLGDLVAAERQPESLIQAVRRATDKLTDRQQRIVRAMSDGVSKVDAARSMGIHRDTLYVELERIKQVFRDEGLEEFLR